MKKLKWMSLFILAVICSTSCGLIFSPDNPYYYNLSLSFQDASGKDLVKGLGYNGFHNPDSLTEEDPWGEVNSDLYTLDIVLPSDPNTVCKQCSAMLFNLPTYCDLFNGYCYVSLGATDKRINRNHAEMIFNLTCPHIFGTNDVHEIITYWTIINPYNAIPNITCSKIVFDGKEIATKISDNGNCKGLSSATIIVERE